MSEAYERERQNNARLEELSAKVSSLRGVTVDIYDNARSQDVIDNTVRLPFPRALPGLPAPSGPPLGQNPIAEPSRQPPSSPTRFLPWPTSSKAPPDV